MKSEKRPIITGLPSPENSHPNAIFADQTLIEFLGEGLGVREIRSASVHSNLHLPRSRAFVRLADRCKTVAPHPHPLSPRIRSTVDLEANPLGPNSRGEGSQVFVVQTTCVDTKGSVMPKSHSSRRRRQPSNIGLAFRALLVFSLLAIPAPTFAQTQTPDAFESMMLTAKAFRAATEKVQPSLVTIESYGGVAAVQGRIGGIRKQGEGNTTGIVISPDGYIVTSTFNFIQKPPVITVVTSDGKRHTAKIMGQDNIRKICLLKIEGVSDLKVPEMVAEKEVTIGQWAVSIGVGYGDMSPAVSMGIISAKNRIGGKAVQTDANISPANYGGPLVDIKGRMIGICVPMDPQSQSVGAGVQWYDSGIGFAIPISADSPVIKRLKEEGVEVTPPFLGIKLMAVPEREGLWIEEVVRDSPADKAGIRREDCVREIDGEKVSDMLKLRRILNRFESGQEIELTIWFEENKKVEKRTLLLGTPPKPKDGPPTLEPPKIK